MQDERLKEEFEVEERMEYDLKYRKGPLYTGCGDGIVTEDDTLSIT